MRSTAGDLTPERPSLRTRIEGTWFALAAALLFTSLLQAVQPSSWRRPVSDAFWQALSIATLGSLLAIVVAAALVGLGVVAQAMYWLDQLGEAEAVRGTLMRVLIREVAPVTVGLVMLGRSGLIHLRELAIVRDDGTVRVLQAEGIDPCVYLAMPRILAFGIATFCNAVLFTMLAVTIGYATAALLGLSVAGPAEFALAITRELGATGVLILPVKSFLIGLVVGAVICATALAPSADDRDLVLPQGFFRGLIAVFVVSVASSLLL